MVQYSISYSITVLIGKSQHNFKASELLASWVNYTINNEKLPRLTFANLLIDIIEFGGRMFDELIQNYEYVWILHWFLQFANKVWHNSPNLHIVMPNFVFYSTLHDNVLSLSWITEWACVSHACIRTHHQRSLVSVVLTICTKHSHIYGKGMMKVMWDAIMNSVYQ